ncbi:hypothetical protein RIEGSTA812A_PEG_261 [invertebrate metagenome]|uniref:Uncharacterized protein n=1 Tax=invertebrate metagenome TaxID=1711999 RepID=A0A484H9D8_9ZZZZ
MHQNAQRMVQAGCLAKAARWLARPLLSRLLISGSLAASSD